MTSATRSTPAFGAAPPYAAGSKNAPTYRSSIAPRNKPLRSMIAWGFRMAWKRADSTVPIARAKRTSLSVNGRCRGTRNT